jgi:hypothetical protein
LGGSFCEEDGRPYHEECIRKKDSSTAQDEKDSRSAWDLMKAENKCSSCSKKLAVGEGLSVKAPFKSSNFTSKRYYFHEECFNCDKCRCKLSGQFVVSEGGFFCQKCGGGNAVVDVADPCTKCSKPLVGNLKKALGKVYHADCFNCHKCSRNFPNGEFVDVNGYPTCESCA